jgi:hypothetical protein
VYILLIRELEAMLVNIRKLKKETLININIYVVLNLALVCPDAIEGIRLRPVNGISLPFPPNEDPTTR